MIVSAITALESIPGAGELYIGDFRGHPSALHGMMEAVHATRHERYLNKWDIGNEKGYYWQDNTIALAATIYNGNTRATGHYAHTALIIYDKHWHGRNRAKNKSLTAEE